MGSCEPSKYYVTNNGNMKTNNLMEYPSLRDSGNSFEIRDYHSARTRNNRVAQNGSNIYPVLSSDQLGNHALHVHDYD